MITENRIINRKNLKQLCIDFDLYTLGTSEEYEEMLKSAVFEGHLTTEKIVEIAKNILEHSETDIELGSLCAEINRAAYTFFIEEENRRKGNTMNKNLTNIKTEYFLIVNGVKQLFCFETKEEAINYARPHLNNETKIEVLTVKTEIIVEKTQETIE
jgi:hypothetical protein